MNRMTISVPGIDTTYPNYETVKEHLFMRLCSPEENQELLKHVPHTAVQDMEATYHLLLPGEADGIASIEVDHELFGHFNISKEQLHQDALENTPKLLPPEIHALSDVLMGDAKPYESVSEDWQERFRKQLQDIDFNPYDLYVLSNDRMVNGAAVICYPEIMQQIGDQVGESFFVLPSSVHEVLLVSDNGTLHLKELEQMVKEINTYEVMPEDRLSNSVYHYDINARIFERGADFEARQKEAMLHGVQSVPAGKGVMERESIKSQLEDAAKESKAQPVRHIPVKQQMLS